MAVSQAIVAEVDRAGLLYSCDNAPGITRQRKESEFIYRSPIGSLITDPNELERIRKLAIPPAYKDVWICSDPNGHLQATGFDDRGRKQYRYHPLFREIRDQSKFERLATFGKVLPLLRRNIDRDLRRRDLCRQRVLAFVVCLLERSLIRIGNQEYAKENESYGLTTMLKGHALVSGPSIEFAFLGKSKVRHHIKIQDRRLARLMKRLQGLPGQELLQYIDEDGEPRSIHSEDVNLYLREATGQHFTAKYFRTWWASLLALSELSGKEPPATKTQAARTIGAALKAVSKQLGNTPAICRKCYVHPCIVEGYREGALHNCPEIPNQPGLTDASLAKTESCLITFLEKAAASKSRTAFHEV